MIGRMVSRGETMLDLGERCLIALSVALSVTASLLFLVALSHQMLPLPEQGASASWIALLRKCQTGIAVTSAMGAILAAMLVLTPQHMRTALERLRNEPLLWGVLIVACWLWIGIFPAVYFRRSLAGVQILAAACIWHRQLAALGRATFATGYYPRLAALYLVVGATVKVLPGGHIPPFNGGIAGWTFKLPTYPTTVTLAGIQLKRDDGATVWYSGALVSPQGFFFRQYLHYEKDDERLKDLLQYYFQLYEYHYPYLEKGIYRNQRYLGALTYPNHMTYGMMPYTAFSPSRITTLQYVAEIYDAATRQRQQTIVYYTYDVRLRQLKRGEN